MDNQERAERAVEIVRMAIDLRLIDDNGVLTGARDLATNLLHLFRGAGFEPDAEVNAFVNMFNVEESEDGPRAYLPDLD
jgi:hypothetical protein